jgi:hypothetical protein
MKRSNEKTVKMQKLRRVVERLRNFRSSTPPPARKQSWFERLKERLRIASAAARESDD